MRANGSALLRQQRRLIMQQIFELLLARGDLESWCLSSQLSMLSRSYRDTAAEWRRTATKFDLEFNYHHKQTINFAALMRDCTRLRHLTLSQHIGDGKAVASILRRNPRLERVELDTVDDVTEELCILFAALPRLTHLRVLSLDESIPASSLVPIARQCPMLTEIDFAFCESVSDEFLYALAQSRCPLRSLRLSSKRPNQLTDDGAVAVIEAHRETLEAFGFSKFLGDRTALALSRCAHVREFIACGSSTLTHVGVAAVARACHELTLFSVQESFFNELPAILTSLSEHATKLEIILLSGTHEQGAFSRANAVVEALRRLAAAAPCLKTIRLQRHWFDGQGLVGLLSNTGPALTNLSLESAIGLANDDIVAIGTHCRTLRSLSLTNAQISADVPATWVRLTECCPHLTYFAAPNSYYINDAVVIAFARNCKRISCLQLWSHGNITDTALQTLASCCRELEELTIASPLVTDDGIAALAGMRSLRGLFVRNGHLTDRTCDLLKSSRVLQVSLPLRHLVVDSASDSDSETDRISMEAVLELQAAGVQVLNLNTGNRIR